MTTEQAPAASSRRIPPVLARRVVPAGWPAFAPVALAGLVAVIWVAYVHPLVHFDIDVFLRAGTAVAAGRDPYPRPGTADVYSGFAFVYPYLVAFPFALLAWLPRGGAAALFIGLSVLAVLAGCRLAGARRFRLYALVLAASCTIIGLQMGTLNAALFAGLAALWRLRDRPVAAGGLAALLVYSKLFLVPLPLWLLLTGRWRAAAVAACALGALFGVGELASPVDIAAYSDMLGVLARAEAPAGLGLTGLLMNVGLGLTPATWVARAVAAALLASCWAVGRCAARAQARAWGAGDDGLLFAATVAAALLASPIVWSHYLLLLAAPLLVLEGGERAGALATATVVSWLLVTPHLSTPPDLVVSALVLAALAARPLAGAARRAAGERGIGRLATLAVPAAAIAVPALAGLELCWALARAHHGGDAVTGAYLVTLGLLALPAWGARQVHGRPTSPSRDPRTPYLAVSGVEPQVDDE
ncbi:MULTISPECIES: glycosyltransferase 87 family protein [unclassified Pseudofrankia]|uniref:glycosyltransferase 87 family protein n=1 Tax=unclassified Pseudofrankia TaxID=2994372 RepID=UPI000B3328DA|nr:glycosyltransferase 87 family protein [Pseudofrankia sp. BMG5.37]